MSLISPHHIDFADTLLNQCRHISLRYFRHENQRLLKSDRTPVTLADTTCEMFIREQIMSQFPEHGIIGEEHPDHQREAPWQWIIDPIDGTKSFAAGNPLFGTLLALLHKGEPLFSVIDLPALDERYFGIKGQVTTCQRKNTSAHCQSNDVTELHQARVFATTPDMFDLAHAEQFQRLSDLCQYRGFGGDCYNYALLASGYIELVCEAQMKPFDYLPLCPIIEGACGIITDWQGQALSLSSDGTVIAASNLELHQKALLALQSATTNLKHHPNES